VSRLRIGVQAVRTPAAGSVGLVRVRAGLNQPVPVRRAATQVPALPGLGGGPRHRPALSDVEELRHDYPMPADQRPGLLALPGPRRQAGFWVLSYSGLLSVDIRLCHDSPAKIRPVSFRLGAFGPPLGDATSYHI
jgi:hypothetical protein